MKRNDLRQIAKETIRATETGFYYDSNGIKSELPSWDFSRVEVFSPEALEAIEDDEDEFFERSFYGSGGAQFYLVETDSFEAAKGFDNVLVMNFANAHTPGGGFLNGARAQEESLCRCSTLYASISSDKAKEMYDYNNMQNNPLDSNYMLLSENVVVFRDADCNLLPESEIYEVSVVTIPAPNKNGRASLVKQSLIDHCMQDRIEKMLWMAARNGYRNLVLGAWGCGAFGHDTKNVAQYFYNAFFNGIKFTDFFDTVCFAILHDKDKLQAFQDVFGDKLEASDVASIKKDSSLFGCSASKDFPVCNHKECLDENDIGYCQGILGDGMPFEAELYKSEVGQGLAIIMPLLDEEQFHTRQEVRNVSSSNNITGFKMEAQFIDYSIMDIGMVDDGEVTDRETLQRYIYYFEKNGLLRFTADMYNGAGWYRTDILGNDLIKIVITLSENGQVFAETDLKFRSFEVNSRKKTGRIIRFPKSEK